MKIKICLCRKCGRRYRNLQLALDLNVPIPRAYGKIKRKDDGTLYTTRAHWCSLGRLSRNKRTDITF